MLIRASDPFAAFKRKLEGEPQVSLHADDLPTTDTFSSWPGRKGSYNGVGVNSPLSAKSGWGGRGFAGLRAAHLRPSTSQHITVNEAAAAYTASSAFTWIMAARIRSTAAQRNVLFLGHSSLNNNWRGLYLPSGDAIGVISNRNGTPETSPAGAVAALNEQAIYGLSLSAAGALLVMQLTATGEATLLSATHTMSGTLTVNRFSIGCALLAGAVSSQSAMYVRYLALLHGHALDATQMGKALRHVRDHLGCPLPSDESTNVLVAMPPGLQRWANGSLQVGTALPVVKDNSPVTINGTSSGVSLTDEEFDYGGVATSYVTAGGYLIPAGSAPFTLTALVKRVAGRSWDTSTNYNLVSGPNLRVTLLVSGGKLKFHYAGTLYDTGYNAVANWETGKRQAIALTFDGFTVRVYVNDMVTPVYVLSSVPSRLTEMMNFGAYNLTTGSWQHKAKDFAIYNTALSNDELKRHFAVAAASAYRVVLTGDSNMARCGTDFLAPAGEVAVDYQCRRYIFPRAGLKTQLINKAQSGQRWATASGFAPTSMLAGRSAVEATLNANLWNVALAHCGTNDVHAGQSAATTIAQQTQWANESRASGKYVLVGSWQIPPAQNSTYNAVIDDVNDQMLDLVDTGVLDFVVPRHPDLSNPLDGIHWLPKVNVNDAEHANGYGAMKMGIQLRDALLGVARFHD